MPDHNPWAAPPRPDQGPWQQSPPPAPPRPAPPHPAPPRPAPRQLTSIGPGIPYDTQRSVYPTALLVPGQVGPPAPPPGPPGPLPPAWQHPGAYQPIRPAHRRTFWVALSAAVTVIVVVLGLLVGVTIAHRDPGPVADPGAPSTGSRPSEVPTGPAADVLDARLPVLVEWVEERVGVSFDSPPVVIVLDDVEFEDQLMSGDSSAGAPHYHKQDDVGATARALGLVVDQQAYDDYNSYSGGWIDNVVGFYDTVTKKLYVRGSDWTIDIEVTIVHEMVHALQDQKVALDPVFADTNAYDDSYQAVRALTEGQATLIENDWIVSRGDGYASAYQQELSGRSYTQGDPYSEAMDALPYVLGPRAVARLESAYGPQITLQVLAAPPTTIEQIWDLAGWHRGQPELGDASAPTEPQVPTGAEVLDRGSMGVDLIALLALPPTKWAGQFSTGDPTVSGWAGDSYVTYETGSQTCVDAVISFDSQQAAGDAAAANFVEFTEAGGTVDIAESALSLHRCD